MNYWTREFYDTLEKLLSEALQKVSKIEIVELKGEHYGYGFFVASHNGDPYFSDWIGEDQDKKCRSQKRIDAYEVHNKLHLGYETCMKNLPKQPTAPQLISGLSIRFGMLRLSLAGYGRNQAEMILAYIAYHLKLKKFGETAHYELKDVLRFNEDGHNTYINDFISLAMVS